MPRDNDGVFTLPNGYLAVIGQLAQPEQHNAPLEDIAAALNAVGAATVTPTGGITARTLADKLGEITNATDFGADPTGVADSGPAINAAFVASATVGLPAGNYLIKTPIVIDRSSASFFGLGGTTPFVRTGPGPRLIWHADIGANPMVHAKGSVVFSNLGFKGPAKGSEIAVRCRRATDAGAVYEDTDCAFYGCHFSEWDVAVDHFNRGLTFQDCMTQLCDAAIKLTWDNANVVDDESNDFDILPRGFRAVRVLGNRFHVTTAGILNTGTNADKLRGLIVAGNQMDTGDVLFNGGCQSAVFSGNVVDLTDTTTGVLRFTTAVKDITISGNQFTGEDLADGAPTNLVVFDSTADNITVNGNVFANAGENGLNFGAAVTYLTAIGNTFRAIGDGNSAIHSCIRFISTLTNASFTGNVFAPNANAHCIRGTTGQNFTGVAVQGNAWNRSNTLAGVFGDGGSNSIQT